MSLQSTKLEMKGPALWLRNLSRSVRLTSNTAPPVRALGDVSLQIVPGEVFGLLGPNGAGKTTLIKILAGLLRPDQGKGQVGYDLLKQHRQIRSRVSLVSTTSEVGTDNNLTVRQNLAFWAPVYGLHGRAARTRIDELLNRLDLVDKAEAWPMHISAGQRQRLALARALMAHNRLVFLDEPTNKLDLEGVRSVRSLISEMNRQQGVTVILTTHVMEEADELCGEIALLSSGRLLTHQPTRQLTQSLQLRRPVKVVLKGTLTTRDSQRVEERLAKLPGVMAVLPSSLLIAAHQQPEPGVNTSQPISATAALTELNLESVDLRATMPALLSWVRNKGFQLVSLKAEPVTLQDVFLALNSSLPGSY